MLIVDRRYSFHGLWFDARKHIYKCINQKHNKKTSTTFGFNESMGIELNQPASTIDAEICGTIDYLTDF